MQYINRLWATALLAVSCLHLPNSTVGQPHVFDWVRAVQAYHTPMLTSFNWAEQVTTDKSNNVYMTGQYIRSVDFNPGAGVDSFYSNDYGAYVSKYDAGGSYQWTLSLSTALGRTVGFDQAGNIYWGGSIKGMVDFDPGPGVYNLSSTGGEDFFLAKYDANRNFLWAINAGGSGDDILNSLQVDGAGNVYVTGWIHNSGLTPIDFDPKNPGTKTVQYTMVKDGFIAKYDPNGNCSWARHIEGQDGDSGEKLILDANNNVYVGGYSAGCTFQGSPVPTPSANLSYDAFIVKYTTTGNFVWGKLWGGNDWDFPAAMTMDSKGDLYLTGLFTGTTNYNPSNPGAALTSNGLTDVFVLKVSSAGNYIWSKSFGSTQDDMGRAIATDNADNVYIGGYITGTVNFNPGGTAANYTSNGLTDIFLTKLDAKGDLQWVKGYGSIGYDEINYIHLDPGNNLYFTGDISRDTDFDPGIPGAQVTIVNPNPNHAQNSFVCKLKQNEQQPENIAGLNNSTLIQVYPNPATDLLVIKTKENVDHIKIAINDITGKTCNLPITKMPNSISVNTTALAAGIYLVIYENTKTGTKETRQIKKN